MCLSSCNGGKVEKIVKTEIEYRKTYIVKQQAVSG
jgi:hypothetical protein